MGDRIRWMNDVLMRFRRSILFLLLVVLSACAPSAEQVLQQKTSTAAQWTSSPTSTPSATPTATPNATPTLTLTPTNSLTSTSTNTPTITYTPTYAFPAVEVNMQAHCRYGPSKAYLHAADLYAGDRGTVRGRFEYSNWLYIKFEKLNYFCWVSPSVVDVTGDVTLLYFTEPKLQTIGYNQYGPPKNVNAVRDGNMVTITWKQVNMTKDKDRGYFIEAWVCQDGAYLWWTVSFPNQFKTSYTVQDDSDCGEPSRGEILTVEKHGYSEPAKIPWP